MRFLPLCFPLVSAGSFERFLWVVLSGAELLFCHRVCIGQCWFFWTFLVGGAEWGWAPFPCCSGAKPSPTLLQPCGPQPVRLPCQWHFPGKNPGGGCHCLLQGIFLTLFEPPSPALVMHSLPLSHWGILMNSFSYCLFRRLLKKSPSILNDRVFLVVGFPLSSL